jgi:hypothetical protein
MHIDDIITRFDRVRKSTTSRGYTCRCPAHDDKGPSLSISETNDGRILLHCFAGCSVGDVLAASGLRMSDLFPDRGPENHISTPRHRMSAVEALRCISFEATILAVLAADISAGRTPSPTDLSRARTANYNINQALILAGVK